MTHWGWYWKVKMQRIPKILCSQLPHIDSFAIAKQVQKQNGSVPGFCAITCNSHTQRIMIEQQTCSYGGFRYFFICPRCIQRRRMLYLSTRIECRSCLNLQYKTQRLTPSGRALARQTKLEKQLIKRRGSLLKKPPRMRTHTWNKLVDAARREDIAYEELLCRELRAYYPKQASLIG